MTEKKETPILTLPGWDKYAKTRKLLERVFEVDLAKGSGKKSTRRRKTAKGGRGRSRAQKS